MYEDGVSKSEIQRRTKVNYRIVVRDKITDIDGREHYEINKKETDLAQEKGSADERSLYNLAVE